jgi:hypothetical protein
MKLNYKFVLKMAVFWVAAPCSLAEVLAASIIRAMMGSDNGGSKDL